MTLLHILSTRSITYVKDLFWDYVLCSRCTYSQPAKQSPHVPCIKPHKGDTQILYETEITEYTEVILTNNERTALTNPSKKDI